MRPSWRSNYIRYKSYFSEITAKYKERADIKAYLEILLSLTAISVFSVFALRPTLLTIAELLKEIEAKQKTLTQMQDKIQTLKQAQANYDSEKSKISLLNTAIPERPMPEIFFRQVQNIALEHQIQISAISTGEAIILGESSSEIQNTSEDKPSSPSFNKLKFSLTIELPLDNYSLIPNFLTDFTNMRYPAKLNLLRITTKETGKERSLLIFLEGILPYY